jgi:acyl-homoserine lactone acylase PvdQ
VNRGDVNGAASLDHRAGAAMRMVVSARDLDHAATILPGGQSGDPLSRHYDDQFADFIAGRFKAAPFHQPHGTPERRESFWPVSQRGRDVA